MLEIGHTFIKNNINYTVLDIIDYNNKKYRVSGDGYLVTRKPPHDQMNHYKRKHHEETGYDLPWCFCMLRRGNCRPD